MRKVVLMKLSIHEAEMLKSKYSNCETYRALLSNKYLPIEEVANIDKLYKTNKEKLKLEYMRILEQKSIPYIEGSNYYVSDNNELYIEVY